MNEQAKKKASVKRGDSSDSSKSSSRSTSPALSLHRQQEIRLGPVFDQLFFGHFYDIFGADTSPSGSCTWLKHLPNLAAKWNDDSNSTIMQMSIRAPCMALYGKVTSNPMYRVDAYKWYGVTLREQISKLKDDPPGSSDSTMSALELALVPPLMLAYFEFITGGGERPELAHELHDYDGPDETSLSWAFHLEGAANMLQSYGGPQALRNATSPLPRQFYRTVRIGILYASMARQKAHFFSEESWITEPLSESEKNPFDKLVDVLIGLPHCLEQWSNVESMAIGNGNFNESKRLRLKMQSHELLHKLDSWGQEHQLCLLSLPDPSTMPPVYGDYSPQVTPGHVLETGDQFDNSKCFLAAMLFSGYATLYVLLYKLSSIDPDDAKRSLIYLQQAQYYSEAILSIRVATAAFAPSPDWAFPLNVVSLLGPERRQQQMAVLLVADLESNSRLRKLTLIR